MLESLQVVGVTWWLESADPWTLANLSFEVPWSAEHTRAMRERILQGPPRHLV